MQQMVLYRKTYCTLNMFQALLCSSSGAQEYYTGGCCLWYLVLWFTRCRSGLWDSTNWTHNLQLHTLELLTMGIMVPETCWANNKFCNKEPSVASSWPFYFQAIWRFPYSNKWSQSNTTLYWRLLACVKTTSFEVAIFLATACNHWTLMSGVMFHSNPY